MQQNSQKQGSLSKDDPGLTLPDLPLRDRQTISDDARQRLLRESLQPIKVGNLSEIREMISLLISKRRSDDITIQTKLQWMDDNAQRQIEENVSSMSRGTSLFDLLLDGLNVVKRHMEAVVPMRTAVEEAEKDDPEVRCNIINWDIDQMRFNVDDLIQRRLGGKRYGLRIRWTIQEGVFEFDVFSKKLFKVEDATKTK
jgi:hypothetical protein